MKKSSLVLAGLLFLSNIAFSQCSTTLEQEYAALMALYQSTNGATWTNKTGWSSANPNVVQSVTGWYGITTDAQGRVVNLNLASNNLTGSLPTEIGALCQLQTLVLNNNSIGSSIPAALENLDLLVTLAINNNQFTGSIPTEIGGLASLRTLYLQINQLSGGIPSAIGDLSELRQLWINNNTLSGAIPSSIGNLSNLQYFVAYTNQLSGSIPASLGNVQTLREIWLTENQLSGTIPSEIGNITQLRYLMLSYNQLTGTIPTTLGNLSNLTNIQIASNALSGSIPSSFGNLTNLTAIRLNNNQLTGSIPPSLTNLTSLGLLQLSVNKLSGTLPVGLASIASLNEVYIDQNQFTFTDILPFKQNYADIFGYSPQEKVDTEKVNPAAVGQPLTLVADVDRSSIPASVFNWFKVLNSVTTPVNNGATVITADDASAKFYYTITNPSAPSLTLTSRDQTLELVTCTNPTLDFQTEVLNGTHTFSPSFTGENCAPTYLWDFGDGTTSSDAAPSHSYSQTGTFTVTLTINYKCGPCTANQIVSSHDVTIENSFCGSIYCDGAGNVGIGTQQTNGFRLSVNGKIRANDIIKVYPQSQWSDFVFEKDYKLLPLSEVEKFIKKNGHLPQIPSAAEVEKEGIDLGGMDAKLLQKIEELTLYMIELKKENEQMRQQNEKLTRRVTELEKKNK